MPQDRAIDPSAVTAAQKQMLSGRSERDARRILESLCDPTRLKIVRALEETPLAASDLASVIGRTRSATSQHLRVLREIGAVTATRTGNVVRYRLAEGTVATVIRDASRAFDRLGGDAAE
ncbi:MAG: ArsR/SmtB family transcription factor [Candidatus Limnocylindria bacterium]